MSENRKTVENCTIGLLIFKKSMRKSPEHHMIVHGKSQCPIVTCNPHALDISESIRTSYFLVNATLGEFNVKYVPSQTVVRL